MSSSSRRKFVGARMSDDLVIEIIARLPTKSLRRFECVSKSWRRFISDVSYRRKIILPMSGFLFYKKERHDPRREHYAPISYPQQDHKEYCREFESRLKSLPLYSRVVVVHSCNGLLLLLVDKDKRGSVLYIVWNPTTNELVALPKRRKMHRLCFLAYDPRESPHYEVVRFTYDDGLRPIVEIYSSLSRDWDELRFDYRYPVPIFGWEEPMALYHKGALHMLSLPNYILRFKLEKGNFKLMSLPKLKNEVNSYIACIGESRGHLYYATNLSTRFELIIWMFDGGSSKKWVLKHRMSTKVFFEHPLTRDHAYNIRPIAFHPDSEVIYISIPSKILAYHPSSGMSEEICRTTTNIDWTKVLTVSPCLESLDPPGGLFIRR